MVNRDKRLKKGIESIEEEIKEHRKKIKIAIAKGEEELVRYHEKEIRGMEKQIERKKRILDK